MNTPAMQITRALGGEWRGATGIARCPAHDDRVPSLAIAEQDGKVLVHCHAGCLQKTVVSALYRLRVWPTQDAARHRRNSNLQAPSRYEPNIDRSHWDLALKIWQASVQAEGSPAKQYLLHRGITTPAPASLRFSPRLRHTRTGEYLPAILAAIHDSADII